MTQTVEIPNLEKESTPETSDIVESSETGTQTAETAEEIASRQFHEYVQGRLEAIRSPATRELFADHLETLVNTGSAFLRNARESRVESFETANNRPPTELELDNIENKVMYNLLEGIAAAYVTPGFESVDNPQNSANIAAHMAQGNQERIAGYVLADVAQMSGLTLPEYFDLEKPENSKSICFKALVQQQQTRFPTLSDAQAAESVVTSLGLRSLAEKSN